MSHWSRSEYADRIRSGVQGVLSRNAVEYSCFLVSRKSADSSVANRWEVITLTPRGRLTFRLETTPFDSDDILMEKIADAVSSVLSSVGEGSRRHSVVYCWCGHSGDSPAAELGDHYVQSTERPGARYGPELRCHECDNHPQDIEKMKRRPQAVRCPNCYGGYLRSENGSALRELCGACNGMGYLKPDWYRSRQTLTT